jgi:dTDP-4-amino-4,6-dideoxygalactose transaminase
MLVTNNPRYAEKARYLTTQARIHDVEYLHDDVGYNYRMTNLQAALGVAQLEQLGIILAKKRAITAYYAEHLSSIPGLSFLSPQPWALSNCWLNTVLYKESQLGLNPREIMRKMAEEGIETRPLFSPLHSQKPLRKYNHKRLPVAEQCQGINLPSSQDINPEALQCVISTLKRIVSRGERPRTNLGNAA